MEFSWSEYTEETAGNGDAFGLQITLGLFIASRCHSIERGDIRCGFYVIVIGDCHRDRQIHDHILLLGTRFQVMDLLARFLRGSLSVQGLRRETNRAFGAATRELLHQKPLSGDALTFLHDVMQHQDDGVRKRYQRLGLSGDKGNRLKSLLVENGILEEQEVKTGRTYKLLLRVTPRARERLGVKKSLGRGSLAHEYWKRFYAETLRQEGYHVELEAPRKTGRVDVLAVKTSESIAVEVETGKSDAVWNVTQDLLSGFKHVVVVATNEASRTKVETQLAKVGLLIPTRVEVVLRDEFQRAV